MPSYTRNNSTKLSEWLQHQWNAIGFWHIVLIPLSWLFWLISGLRRAAYKTGIFRSYKMPVPVIIVGNISVGGTGKTPLVIWLVEQLQRDGFHPAIISRGYGGKREVPTLVSGTSDPRDVGDEPLLLAKRSHCPVWVGRNRVATAQALLEAYPECDVIISDDGLQHYALERDFEFVVIDSNRGFGNGCLLPAGPLRERESRLATIDAVINNGGRPLQGQFSMRLEGQNFFNLCDSGQVARVEDFAEKNIGAVAGIGNPSRFFEHLTKLGLVFKGLAFPDHHIFKPTDLDIAGADIILMTEKDAVKCKVFAEPNWWYMPVDAVVDEALFTYIKNRLNQL
jgi:tetraacyldisaccharide 4'-kinase